MGGHQPEGRRQGGVFQALRQCLERCRGRGDSLLRPDAELPVKGIPAPADGLPQRSHSLRQAASYMWAALYLECRTTRRPTHLGHFSYSSVSTPPELRLECPTDASTSIGQ